ncbi:MAG: DUF4136 domain-containing protein [Thiohalophilus sp.]|jgi:hypothetical protein
MNGIRHLVLLIVSLLLVSCASTVNVDYDQAYNFAAVKTFALQSKPVKISDDPRLTSPMMQQRVVSAIQAGLSAKGLRSDDKAPDVRITYRIDVKQEIESDRSGVSVGIGTYSRHVGVGVGYGFPASDVESYDTMVLTIDMVVPQSGKLIWRGSDSRRLYAGSTPESNTKLVNDLVKNILEKYPPG